MPSFHPTLPIDRIQCYLIPELKDLDKDYNNSIVQRALDRYQQHLPEEVSDLFHENKRIHRNVDSLDSHQLCAVFCSRGVS
jgi:hypothetical protein